MSRGVVPLELCNESWLSDWTHMTTAMTREAQGERNPREWERGKVSCQGWVLVIP